jgi:hypothetical protein
MDAQLLIEVQIGALAFTANEKLSMLIDRLDELVARLPVAARPIDDAKIKYVTRAIKANEACYRRHQYMMDVLKIAVPATTNSDFCSKLIKIEDEDALEQEIHAVLVNDANAANQHGANASVNAVEAGRGRGRGARGRGRGDNRKRRHFNSGQDFARGQAQQPEQNYYGRDNGGPHMRGDQRQNGGRAGRGPFGQGDRGRGGGRGANKRVLSPAIGVIAQAMRLLTATRVVMASRGLPFAAERWRTGSTADPITGWPSHSSRRVHDSILTRGQRLTCV